MLRVLDQESLAWIWMLDGILLTWCLNTCFHTRMSFLCSLISIMVHNYWLQIIGILLRSYWSSWNSSMTPMLFCLVFIILQVHLFIHCILEIASHLHACEKGHNLRAIVYPMKLKFLKYWQDIPLLYSYAFILDPRAKMRGFFNYLVNTLVLSTVHTMLMSKLNCINCLTNMRASLMQLCLKGLHNHHIIQVRKSRH